MHGLVEEQLGAYHGGVYTPSGGPVSTMPGRGLPYFRICTFVT
jgi:hypothetical protein